MTETNVGAARTKAQDKERKKGKKPPSFPHVHRETAKKFKRAWVDKAKIKSQWKKQKIREGLDEQRRLDIPVYEDERRDVANDSQDEEEENSTRDASLPAPIAPTRLDPASDPEDETVQEHSPHIHPSRSHLHSRRGSKSKTKRSGTDRDVERPMKKRRIDAERLDCSNGKDKDGASIRDLMREAYSPSNLHTFKADPLKRRRGGGGTPATPGSGRGRERGEKGLGRGQPNMKLRMNAMLAKIKQDFA